MICPACHEPMIVVEYKQIELDICVACRGVWFDADELELLLGALEVLDLAASELFRPLPGKPAEKPRKCPYCRRRMEKALTGPGEGVMIDRCKRGHGLWFDGGELDTVVNSLQKPAEGAEEPKKAGKQVGSFLADMLFGDDDEREEKGERE